MNTPVIDSFHALKQRVLPSSHPTHNNFCTTNLLENMRKKRLAFTAEKMASQLNISLISRIKPSPLRPEIPGHIHE